MNGYAVARYTPWSRPSAVTIDALTPRAPETILLRSPHLCALFVTSKLRNRMHVRGSFTRAWLGVLNGAERPAGKTLSLRRDGRRALGAAA